MLVDSVRWSVALGGFLALSGCASGEAGMVASRTTSTPHALVVDAYTLGVSASLNPNTAGGNIGYRHTAYLYTHRPGDPESGTGRWIFFRTPLPRREPVAIAIETGGLDLPLNSSSAGFGFGLQNHFFMRIPVTQSAVIRLHYKPSALAETRVENSETKPHAK